MWVLKARRKVVTVVMDYGLTHTKAPPGDRGIVNGSAKSSDINRSDQRRASGGRGNVCLVSECVKRFWTTRHSTWRWWTTWTPPPLSPPWSLSPRRPMGGRTDYLKRSVYMTEKWTFWQKMLEIRPYEFKCIEQLRISAMYFFIKTLIFTFILCCNL